MVEKNMYLPEKIKYSKQYIGIKTQKPITTVWNSLYTVIINTLTRALWSVRSRRFVVLSENGVRDV